MRTVCGDELAPVDYVDVVDNIPASKPSEGWLLRGVVSNLRYTEREELKQLQAIQPALQRPEATCAVLIPIRKTAAWWALPQDERRAIFEQHSMHTQIGLEYLPAIARKLHHGRDLGEPFDFLTWFEFAPHHKPLFDDLLRRLRASLEWSYVDREVEVRLLRAAA
jgi:hypothetical protein